MSVLVLTNEHICYVGKEYHQTNCRQHHMRFDKLTVMNANIATFYLEAKPRRQGCNEARWRQGQEASLAPPCSKQRSFGSKCVVLKKVLVTLLGLFGAPMFETEVFWKQMHCIEESTCDTVGTFRRPPQ